MGRALDIEAQFAQAMAQVTPKSRARLGLAVSGGGDSMALMALASRWGDAALRIATVDHGLRETSAQEARMVGSAAQQLGLPHVTLRWTGWTGQGNLQNAARKGRQALLTDWARAERLDAVLLGHTRDDQAETFLLRLARGSGVDGLAGMQAKSTAQGILWLRPLLQISRDDLRQWLRAKGLDWAEDPSNADPAFDRVKARQMRDLLSQLGLTSSRLAQTAERMAEARAVLDLAADAAQTRVWQAEHGDIVLDAPAFDALPEDTRYRIAARALCAVASQPYRPRLKTLRLAFESPRATLHGCLVTRTPTTLRITREPRAVAGLRVPLGEIWDRRWQVTPPERTNAIEGLTVAALGEDGLAACSDRAVWEVPRPSLLASPAVWHGSRLIAAPLAGFQPQWRVTLCQTAM